jgi:spoIIIJ-associated protein
MTNYEFEGKTAEEAIDNASRELNVPVEELDVDIIEPGSAGIFGLVGTKKAKIKVNLAIDEFNDNEKHEKQDGVALAKESLEGLLALIPVNTTVTAQQSDGKIDLSIEGDTSGLLIGRKGRTLDAIQFLINKIVSKKLDRKIRVVVDSENYRKRRIDSLTQLAHKLGEKAKKAKKAVSTSPLNPHDRRIVHLALKKENGLDTRSRGEGILKKVIIIPKK